MTLFRDAINAARQRSEDSRKRSIEERRKRDAEYSIEHEAKRKFLSHCRRAKRHEYETWLAGYIANGGEIQGVYDYEWSRWDWYTLQANLLVLPHCYGAMSFNLIVPNGFEIDARNKGHIDIYYMDGFKADGLAAIFNDIVEPADAL